MHCMPHEIQNICIGIRLPGAAQLFIFTYAVVWYGLCIYMHLLCLTILRLTSYNNQKSFF